MKKNIEWLKEEVGELPCVDTVFNSDGSSYIDSAVPVMAVYDLLDQLDESEAKKIIDLEYELFLEKTKNSKNSFYWFTAKRTPLITDISYMSKDNHFYGFKEVPNYHFIEKHDLRFITNCPLDDLIEQYK